MCQAPTFDVRIFVGEKPRGVLICSPGNANQGFAASKCSVAPGDTVTIEMHQQPNDRKCSTEAIGGAHYGPVLVGFLISSRRPKLTQYQVYLSKVSNSATADGSTPFFKIYEDTWGQNTAGGGGSDDYWGTKDLNTHCGKLDVKIPAGLAPGDYLLRAEAIALHAAGSSGGAQVNDFAVQS